jgi:hypothetical protein
MENPDKSAQLVVGRTVQNFRDCGQPLRTGSRILPCRNCGISIAFSTSKQIQEALEQGAIPICSPCMKKMPQKILDKVAPVFTENFTKQSARADSETRKDWDDFLARLKGKK